MNQTSTGFFYLIPAVFCNIIRLFVNEAMPGLGFSGSICPPKTRFKGIKSFVLLFLFFFFGVKSQAAWLTLGRDP